jgi:hypothetical protein
MRVILANGATLNTNAATTATITIPILLVQNYELQVTQGATVVTKKFSAIVNPNVVSNQCLQVYWTESIIMLMTLPKQL